MNSDKTQATKGRAAITQAADVQVVPDVRVELISGSWGRTAGMVPLYGSAP